MHLQALKYLYTVLFECYFHTIYMGIRRFSGVHEKGQISAYRLKMNADAFWYRGHIQLWKCKALFQYMT